LRYADKRGMSPEEKTTLEMWEHCLTRLADDPMTLDRECDWVIKAHLIEAYRERHDCELGDPRVALLDLQYHDVDRQRGLFYKMQDRGLVERTCTDAEINHAVENPPETTRARLRG